MARADVNILLVDDEPKNLIALDAILGETGWHLVHAGSGSEALRQVLREEFAAILLDVNMPGLDGFETAALIRQREQSGDTPIIFLTAATRGETFMARGYSVGAVDYIVKPLDQDILRSKVAVFVELFRKTQQVREQASALAETTAFLNSVLESATEYAITAMDRDGQVLTWNQGARGIYGYAPEEMIGRNSIRTLSAPEDVAEGRVDELLRTARESGTAEATIERLRKDGSRFLASVVINRRLDSAGRHSGYVSISRDITEQQRAEAERLRFQEEQAARKEAEAARDQFQQVVDVLPEGVMLADADGRVFLSNAAAHEILGERPPALSVPEYQAFGIVALDGTPVAAEELPLARSVLRGEVVRGEQLLIPNKQNGRAVPALVNAAPLRNSAGDVVGGVMAFQDISAIKELERQKDAFLAAASHDLKNPLTAIKARAQMLRRRADQLTGPPPKPFLDGLDIIDETATSLSTMINELLDVTRLQMRRPLDLDRREMDLVALVRKTASSLQPTSDRHEIRVHTASAELTGVWDRGRLERVLGNLVSNAIKYSPAGGEVVLCLGTISYEGRPYAELKVIDRGVGIPEAELPRVFDRFYRASNVAGRIEGSGIGLAGACQIVEQHGGRILVESKEGEGSTFTMHLPLDEPAALVAS